MKSILLITILQLFCLSLFSQKQAPSGCSVITVAKDSSVFFGGNDDFNNPDQYYWVEPGDSSRYGVIWIGKPDNPQQGVNEKFLAYDANGLPRFEVNPHPERIPVKGEYYHNYLMQIMHECSTVTEVIEWANKHQHFPYMHDQMHFADKTGDAVIISAGKDGEMVFTRKAPGDGFLVSTNFNVANPANASEYPCWRYDKANEMLGQLINREGSLTFIDITNVMDAIHQEGASWTIESLVADLTNGVIYLYFFYQYDTPVIINVQEELLNPREAGPLSRLFPEDVQQEAASRYRQVTKPVRINNVIGRSWSALILCSLILLLIIPPLNKGLRFWIPAILVLGPFALAARLLTLNPASTSIWRKALIETAGNIVTVVIPYLVALVIMILSMISGGVGQQQQALLIFAFPLLASWIIFQSPILALTGKVNFFKFLFQHLPQALATTFLVLGGIFPLSMVLINKTIVMSQLIPLSPWIVMTWLAIIVAGSMIGGVFVFFYEYWAVKRGYQAWIVFTGNEGEVSTPKWGKIWWWLPISILFLLAGLIAGVMLLKVL
ncbi:MAG: hypothetical protein MUC78_03830 [Bacteroidales bacterium]|jgi:hypothetical protein|nr:hypothetical protein [Bacteroidales bacterium]